MPDDQDLAFGKAAVERGFITEQQLQECVRIVATVTQAGLKRSLADILVEKSFITEMQAEILGRATAGVGDVKVIGGFELVEKIGEGGMGAVFKARQISMDRTVALKLLPDRLAKDKEFTARFLREARVAAKLDHVNVVRGIDVGQDGEYYYFAMEFVEGESVADVLRREGAIPEDRALRIGVQVARALDHAWEMQLIHRDIKPDNILLTKGDVAKVADLGLARSTSSESTVMTRTGMAVGTPHYISPEQARGEKTIDIRTDIYSLGATLYHMVVGDTPFSGSTAAVVITQHLTENPPPAHARNPKVSENTSRVIAKMMAKKVDGRYADPKQLLEDLELVADGKEPKHAAQAAVPPSAVPTVGMQSGLSSGMGLMSEAELRQFQSEVAVAAAKRSLVPIAAGAGALIVGLVILIAVLATRGGGQEEMARRELAAVRTLVAVGKLDSAYDDAVKGAALYADTDQADEFLALVKEIEGKKKAIEDEEERKRQEGEQAKEKERLQKLKDAQLAEARGLLQEAGALLAENRFAEARAALGRSAPKIEEAALGKEMAGLTRRIDAAEKAERERLAREKAEAERLRREETEAEARAREEAEAAREKEFADRVALGDSRFAKGDFAGALEAYGGAEKIKSTPELKDKMADCRFRSAVAKGRAAQDRDDLVMAAEWYRKALDMRDDPAVSARLKEVLDLKRQRELRTLMAVIRGVDPEKATDEAEIRSALDAAKKAVELAGEKEAAELEAHARGLERALQYRIALEDAQVALAAGEWERAKKAALEALEARPRDLQASGIATRARIEMNRPKKVSSSVGMDLVWVRGGVFEMGTHSGEADERPVHRVRLGGFYIGRTEVTNAQYEKFNPRHAKRRGKYSRGPEDPVVNVSWQEAVEFCRWLSQQERKRYRLPTEAEWEYAARGDTDRVYPWGNEPPMAPVKRAAGDAPAEGEKGAASGAVLRANFGEGESKSSWQRDGFVYAAPAGSFPGGASPFGCLDMAGNVWEWCSDWYGPYRSSSGVSENPTGPSSGTKRAVRGGSWYHDASSLRAANRWSKAPGKMSSTVGFRCVMEAE